MAKGKSKQRSSGTWPGAVERIAIRALDKGQLLTLFPVAWITMVLWKVPNDEVFDLVKYVVGNLHTELGWVLFGIATLAWFVHVKNLRRIFYVETSRIGNEKSLLQQKKTDVPIKSSKD